jgi:hypothetical protein
MENFEDFRNKIKLISHALDLGAEISLLGSPVRPILASISDLLSVLKEWIRSGLNRDGRYLGPVFLEDIEVQEDEIFGLTKNEMSTYSFVDGKYQKGVFDLLGNPLSVKVELDEIIQVDYKDRLKIMQYLEDIEQSLVFFAESGNPDFLFMRNLRRFLSPNWELRPVKSKKAQTNKSFYYGRRHRDKVPITKRKK